MADLRIFLADDHVVVREGLTSLIDAQPDMQVIGETGDGNSACELVSGLRPDVVIS
jgi:DNA-binding NarL/FixJ family response regulator